MKRSLRIQNSSKACTIGLLSIAVFAAILSGTAAVAAGSKDGAQVRDMIRKWHFKEIGYMFSDGTRKLLAVETKDGKVALWDPAQDTLSPPLEERCTVKSIHVLIDSTCIDALGLHPFNANVLWAPIPGVYKPPTNASFCGGAKIYLRGTGEEGRKWGGYYTVRAADGSAESFYIIYRVWKPDRREAEAFKAAGATFREYYPLVFLSSIDIGNGRTLFFLPNGYWGYPILLEMKSAPRSIWCSDANVFIVPKQALFPVLKKAGPDEDARYKAALKVMSECSGGVQ